MIYQSTYQAANAVSKAVEEHFSRHIAAARAEGEIDLAPEPPAAVAEAIIDAAFWASLRREEGHSPKISIAFLHPDQAEGPLLFAQSLPFNPKVLTKLAPGIERAGVHLGVWFNGHELYVWGTTLKIPNFCFVLDVSEPGLLVIKHRRFKGFGKYTNVAVLKGHEVKIVDESCANLPDCPEILKSLLGLAPPALRSDPVNVSIQLAVSMRSHKRGGTLLIIPQNSATWQDSIIQPMQYAAGPAFRGLSGLIGQVVPKENDILLRTFLAQEVENVAGLTAVDGATILNTDFELLAFGTKIGRPWGSPVIEQLAFVEPVLGGGEEVIQAGQIGGTRHLSAAQFVHDQHDSIALTASQDGHFTLFSWSPSREMVQAHRIDSLLV